MSAKAANTTEAKTKQEEGGDGPLLDPSAPPLKNARQRQRARLHHL